MNMPGLPEEEWQTEDISEKMELMPMAKNKELVSRLIL